MAEIPVAYEYDGAPFEGMVVYDDSITGKRPSVFMQPDWFGVCRHTIDMAMDVAGQDYVVMVADMFGAGYGIKEKTFEELGTAARGTRADVPFILGCGAVANAALTAAANELDLIDADKAAAIGYCMGGGFVLEQVRAGADFKATVVFHVTAPNPVDPETKPNIKGRVLALHGSADPVTPASQMEALAAELTEAEVDWQVTTFGHAMHSFCVEGANNPAGGSLYDKALCQKSYRMMRDFFAETF
jgi:dienelactone hydrolase